MEARDPGCIDALVRAAQRVVQVRYISAKLDRSRRQFCGDSAKQT